MNTNLTNNPEFDDLFNYSNQTDEDKHEARVLMYRFLSEIERIEGQKRGLKKKLADGIHRSTSYITQLFNGDKIINLLTLAKFQRILNIKFKIVAYTEGDFYNANLNSNVTQNIFLMPSTEGNGYSGGAVQVVAKSEPVLS